MKSFFDSRLKPILEWVNAGILFMMFAVVLLQISARTIFAIPVSWTDDLCRSTYIFMVFLGASLAMRDQGAHIAVDIAIQFLSEKGKRIFRIIGALVMVPFLIVFIIGAFDNVVTYWGSVVSTLGWLRRGHLYGITAISGCLMLIYNGLNLYDDIRRK
jgi:TRAP-type C4-dicarboxylate transport system permease small subunit